MNGKKKVVVVAIIFTSIHLIEDLMWLTIGRYTTLPYGYILAVILLLGILGALAIRHPKAKKFLGH